MSFSYCLEIWIKGFIYTVPSFSYVKIPLIKLQVTLHHTHHVCRSKTMQDKRFTLTDF